LDVAARRHVLVILSLPSAVNIMNPGLPDLSDDHPIEAAIVAQFQRDGHTVLRGLASPAEVAAYRPVIEAAASKYKWKTRPLDERDTYGKAFLQIVNLWQRDEAVARFSLARRFARAAAELMGVQGVRLYHDQALFKEPGGGRTPFHQDQYYWPLDGDTTITMWMPLVDVPVEIGTMTFGSGSHQMGYLGEFAISDTSDSVFASLIEEQGIPLQTHGALAAGDATFHAGWTLHGAPPNPTGTMRSVMTIIYFADGMRATEPDHPLRKHDLRIWLPGIEPGQLAASPINPLLYSA
jgi:ectoine hydroxylase-related dioxygenase (phytanoyl-CoA dioxygenase family)